MDNNKLKSKIFPYTKNISKLKYDDEGLWSITHPDDAKYISILIKQELEKNGITNNINVLDATAGLGGNLISFAKFFNFVTGIEIDKKRFDMLVNNVSCYNITNVSLINNDCIEYLKNNDSNDITVYFIDPPWGGPDYKKHDTIDVFLDKYNMYQIIKLIPKNKIVVLKVPYNYNLNLLKEFNLSIKKIRNILIIIIHT